MSDWEEELEQKRIDDLERLENLEKCIERIKESMSVVISKSIDEIDKNELNNVIREIEWEIGCLDENS